MLRKELCSRGEQLMHRSARFLHGLSSVPRRYGLTSSELLPDLGHVVGDGGICLQLGCYLIVAVQDGGVVPAAQFFADLGKGAIVLVTNQVDGDVPCQRGPPVSLPAGQVIDRQTEMVGDYLQIPSDILLAGRSC